MAILREMDGRLVVTDNNEKLWIEPWGENALRVRSTKMPQMPPENWALEAPHSASAEIVVGEKEAAVTNGKITAKVTKAGKLTFYNQNGKLLFLAGSRGIFPCLRQNGKILIAPLFVSLVIAARVCHADKMSDAP